MLTVLRAGSISAVELLEFHIDRIQRLNPAINAIVFRDFDRARSAARAADRHRAAGEDAPLLGLPITIKDCIYVEGLPATGGFAPRKNAIAERDALSTARLRSVGAVIMGNTNVPPFAGDWQTDNSIYGRTNNPWNLNFTSGGSTGGGAAAVAAGLSPIELGGDFSGSIRVPAAFCGVYGHKSSETVAARSGQFPASNRPNGATAMSVQGPLARSAEDLELILNVIAGPEIGEDVAWRIELPPPRHDRIDNFRVGLWRSPQWLPVDDEIQAALESVAQTLRTIGAVVDYVQPVYLDDFKQYAKTYLSIMTAINSAGKPPEMRRKNAELFRSTGDEFLGAFASGVDSSAADYIRWFSERERYRVAYRKFFKNWDILLAPAQMVNAFRHDDRSQLERSLEVNGRQVPYLHLAVIPGLCNLVGHPGTAFPAGRTGSGLPIGLQAIGPYLEDQTTIRFAELMASEIGGFIPPPGFA